MTYTRDNKGRFIKGFENPTRKAKVVLVCKWCGKDYERLPSKVKGSRFCNRTCTAKWVAKNHLNKNIAMRNYRREKNPSWRGGIRHASGYRFVLLPEHPAANDKGYVQEHRLFMEKHLGRYLTKKERVHHINGNKADNRLENLKLYSSQREHLKEHLTKGTVKNNYWLGKKMQVETRLKMSESAKRAWENRK